MVKFIAFCAEGLEDIVIDDLKKAGTISETEINKGHLFFDFQGDFKELLGIKTVDDILVFVRKFSGINRYRTSLRNIRHQATKANIMEALKTCRQVRQVSEKITFTVQTSYHGKRDYKASEVNQIVSESIIKHYGWNYNKAGLVELHISVILTQELSFIGISLDNEPIHGKNKLITVPGSLKSSVVCSLIKIAGIKNTDTILDPMCGSGIIAIEASSIGKKTLAGDINKESLELAISNNSARNANVEFHLWDASKTGLSDSCVDKIISNLPFDKQVKLDIDDEKFFSDFINEMIRVSKRGARVVFLTRHPEIVSNILQKQFSVIQKINILNSGLDCVIVVAVRL